MARETKKSQVLTKRQASVINKGNRNISGNINSLMDNLNTMTYGINRTDKIDSLIDDFNSLLKGEMEDITKTANGDTTAFITKLFSENNKKIAASMKDIESLFDAQEGQLEAFLNEQYRNRLIKQADLHEVASQLVELREAIGITRDAIISADIIDGHMCRTITVDNDDMEEDQEDYIPIIEKMEKKFKLQEKIKNFIVPRTLEYGEFFVYCIPYAKIFEKFAKEKHNTNGKYLAYSESETKSLNQIIEKNSKKQLEKLVLESVESSNDITELKAKNPNFQKSISDELSKYLEHVEICNDAVPIPILEEGVPSFREYYTEFVEKTITEDNSEISFDKVMKSIDNGVHSFKQSKNGKSKDEDFSNIKDCYVKLIDPTHLLPIEIMNETIGYYYIQEEDITPLSGILTSTVYYDKFDSNRNENNILSSIAETIVSAFDKKFLEKNEKFKKLIVEALNYYKLNNRRIKFQFIPKEYIIPFTINEDENGHGTSVLENSLFYAKLYLMLLLFKIMTIVLYSNDTKVNYIRQSGIEKNISNKIQEIARKKQQRQITMADMFSYTTLINKIGQGNEMYVPVGKSNERGIETEILQGQDVQLNSDLLEMLKKAYISGTGVPDVLMNYINEADFAKTLELANNRFHGRVVSYQLDFNEQITLLYQNIARFSTTIPEEVIDSISFNFIEPKYSNMNITNDLLNNHNALVEFLIVLYFGQDGVDNPENAPKIKKFRKALAEDRLPMLNFNEIDEMFRQSSLEGTEENLNPDNNDDSE